MYTATILLKLDMFYVACQGDIYELKWIIKKFSIHLAKCILLNEKWKIDMKGIYSST